MREATADALAIVPVRSPAELERFVRLPNRINAGDPNWIAPLLLERRQALSPKQNPFFQHADVQLWLAVRNGRDVGRISAQIDRLAPVDPERPAGWFGMLCAEDDPAVFAALFRAAEDWLRARGRHVAVGPFNLSINEEVGLLVDGFDTPPMLLMGHDPPYAGAAIEAQGYAPTKDVYAYLCDIADPLPAGVRRRVERGAAAGVTLRMLDMRRYEEEVRALTEIFNEGWSSNWGFTPLTEAETQHLGDSLKQVIDRRLLWFAEMKGRPVGFIVCLPNVNAAIADLHGRLLPLGWARLLWRLKVRGVTTARVPLMGVKRSVARTLTGQTLPFLLIEAVRAEARKLGITAVELSWVLEDNRAMRSIIETVGAKRYKTYRLYEKSLT